MPDLLSLPFKNPVLIFGLVLLLILLVPIVLRRIRIPGVAGLILAGVLVGEHGLNLLQRTEAIKLFGTIGLLYIMFLAGLEIDLNDLRKSRKKSLTFGMLTFWLPMILGILSGYMLGFDTMTSILLASMFASHTLLTYPIVSRYGLTKIEVVTVTIAGTIITDTLSLLVLSVIASAKKGELDAAFWFGLTIKLAIFVFIVMIIFPKIARWFFRNIESEGTSQYVFVMAVVFVSAFGAELAGIEPIIGAFLAGLSMGRLVPDSSVLYNRIHFTGNALFIPFFLISVGMLVDIEVFVQGYEATMVSLTMVLVALVSKWGAAYMTQKIFYYSVAERNMIFGLSNSQAAATLAAVLVGYNLGIFNDNVLNGTIVMILVTCLISPFATESASRQLALEEQQPGTGQDMQERILVPIANPQTIEHLISFSMMLKDPKVSEPLYPLSVVNDDQEAKEHILTNKRLIEKNSALLQQAGITTRFVARVDVNATGGIIRAAKELLITDIVLGWSGKLFAQDLFFSSILDGLLKNLDQMIFVVKAGFPLNTMKRFWVVLPPNAELEPGFVRMLRSIYRLSRQAGVSLHFYATEETMLALQETGKTEKIELDQHIERYGQYQELAKLAPKMNSKDLIFIVSAREQTISHSKELELIPRFLSRELRKSNFVIVYPAQHIATEDASLV